VIPDPPPSPLSPYLAGRRLTGLPPLGRPSPRRGTHRDPGPPPPGSDRRHRGPSRPPPPGGVCGATGRCPCLRLLALGGPGGGVPGGLPEPLVGGGGMAPGPGAGGRRGTHPAGTPRAGAGAPQPWEAPGLEGEEVSVAFRALEDDPEGPVLRRDVAVVDDRGRFTLPPFPRTLPVGGPGRRGGRWKWGRWRWRPSWMPSSDPPGTRTELRSRRGTAVEGPGRAPDVPSGATPSPGSSWWGSSAGSGSCGGGRDFVKPAGLPGRPSGTPSRTAPNHPRVPPGSRTPARVDGGLPPPG
jgi:hypothetical protein